MIEPILLVHGYSAESAQNTAQSLAATFGDLPAQLRQELQKRGDPAPIVDINISRYISMDDGVDLDDISLAFDRALREQPFYQTQKTFNAIIHSTGALVVRNWVRRFSRDHDPDRSPCRRIIHLAGANLGSGWAHIGESLLAKWLRYIGEGGQERGMAVLEGLELGSAWSIDLHRHFLSVGNRMWEEYGVQEFSLVGSQCPPDWMLVPFRYGKEDGSDGVVRVSASNLNFNYLRIAPARPLYAIDWAAASDWAQDTVTRSVQHQTAAFADGEVFAGGYYALAEQNIAGVDRLAIPFGIPYSTAHSTATIGIVYGLENRANVIPHVADALLCDGSDAARQQLIASFDAATTLSDQTIIGGNAATGESHPSLIRRLLNDAEHLAGVIDRYLTVPEAQYDRHAQVIVRVFDQNGKPINDSAIHFNSLGGDGTPDLLINALFEDTHVNNAAPNTTTFYLRVGKWDAPSRTWVDSLAAVNGVDLEIDCIDAKTNRICFLPLRMRIPEEVLAQYVQPHRTTIIDVALVRLPDAETFSVFPA